jgi:N-acetylmuramic acid 6-phosphate etherase
MRYSKSDEKYYVRVARSGGWGHMLGDEGGGYAIGLKAIQHTLGVFEEMSLGVEIGEVGKLEKAIAAKLGCQVCESASIEILNEILAKKGTQGVKARIAGIAEIVVGLMSEDKSAETIVNSQVAILIGKTLARLVNPKGTHYQPPKKTVLVLAGGLMKNEKYRAALEQQLYQYQFYFRETVVVEDAALMGVKYLS